MKSEDLTQLLNHYLTEMSKIVLQYGGLVILPFEPTIDIRVSILTSAHRRLSAVSKEFIEVFRAHITTTGTSGWRRSRDARAGRSG